MDSSKNTSVLNVKNGSKDNNNESGRDDTFVKHHNQSDSKHTDVVDESEDEEEERYEILLLPDRTQYCLVQNQNRLSPPLASQSMQTTATDNIDLIECLSSGLCTAEEQIDATVSVSPTRIALSNIQEFVETTVVLRKDKKNELGISIVGGNDTYLVRVPSLI